MEVAHAARSALVPKYCLHKPSGRAYVRIRGKVVYVGEYGSAGRKQEYAASWPNSRSRRRCHSPRPAIGSPWSNCASPIGATPKPTMSRTDSPPAKYTSFGQALRALRELYGHTPAAEFGPLALQAVQSQLIERDLARKTINHFFVLSTTLQVGVSQQLLPVTVYQILVDGSGAFPMCVTG